MGFRRFRAKDVLVGEDTRTAWAGLALAVAIFAGVFLAIYLDSSVVSRSLNATSGGIYLAVVALPALYYHRNRGLLVAVALSTAPAYATFIHVVHWGNFSGVPYPRAVVEAIPFGFAFGVVLGLAGVGVAVVAEQVR